MNPHAGENGYIGTEEKKIIIPVIRKLKNNGINVNGPVSADSILIKNNLHKYDCFAFMFHDQALIPFKFISQFSGVNYSGNLDIIRTSPDHGTAYSLIGTKNISDKSLNSYKLIKKILIIESLMVIPKKSLSQNFLIDKNISKKIVNQTNITNKYILEIGPGYGFFN